jgi:hypothetical protein
MAKVRNKRSTAVQKRAEPRSEASEIPRGYGLREFTAFLVEIAREGGASDLRLSDKERAKLIRHGGLLAASVDALTKPPQDGEPSRERERILWQALGSACLITSFQVESPSQVRAIRERIERATEGTRAKSRQIADVIAAEANKVLRTQPAAKAGRIASLIERPVNEQLEALRLPTLKSDTIIRRVKRHRMNIRPSD